MFQSFYNIDVTGRLDDVTMASLGTPRCTVMDMITEWTGHGRVENFNLATRWTKNELTWNVTKFPSNDISEDLVLQTMERAFKVWENHANLRFYKVYKH